MHDVDGLARFIDPLVHRYTITASRLYTEDVTERPFAYSYDVFHSCNNPRYVTASDALSISFTVATHPSLPTLYHTPIKFCNIFSISPVLPIENHPNDCHLLPITGAPSPSTTWISFDSVINSLAPLLLGRGYHALQHILCKSDQLFFSLATQISPNTAIYLTTFENTLSSLQHQLTFLSTNIPPASQPTDSLSLVSICTDPDDGNSFYIVGAT